MKQLPGKKDKVGFGFYWMMLPFMLGALSLTVSVGQLLWHLVGIDDLVSEIMNASTGIWLNITFLIMSVVLLIPAIGVTIWWPVALFFRTVELVLSLRPHPDWVRLWESSLEFREILRKRVPIVYWYTSVMSRFGADMRHPLPVARKWLKAFGTTICILTSLVAVPYLIDKSWSMPVGVKPLFSLAMAISSPVVVDYYLQYTMGRRKDRPPTNRWRHDPPPLLEENHHQLPPP